MNKDTIIGALVTACIFILGIAIWMGVSKNNTTITQPEQIPVATQPVSQTPITQPTQIQSVSQVPNQPTQTQQVQNATPTLQAYNNYGLSFKYPTGSTITTKPISGSVGTTVTVKVPFTTNYDVWTSKSVVMMVYGGSCIDLKANFSTLPQKTINGITYYYSDPDMSETSGMSSISKMRDYYRQTPTRCYKISEYIQGLGNNEHSATATAPADRDAFINAELAVLDQIVASLTLTQ